MNNHVHAALDKVVQRLTGPLEFSARNSGARLSVVKNLGTYISRQILQALADEVYPARIENELLSLRRLFVDFDVCFDETERRRRLTDARTILDRLKNLNEGRVVAVRNIPIQFAKGVGPKRAALLERVGVRTIEEALWCLPWRYEDRSVVTPIAQLTPGMRATIFARVVACRLKSIAPRRPAVLEIVTQDATGTVRAVFFNQPYLEKLFQPDTLIMLTGRVSIGRKGWTDLQLESPFYELLVEEEETLHMGRIVPIYHETRGLTSRQIRTLVKGLLDHYADDLDDILPATIREKYGLSSLRVALSEVHFPSPPADLEALDRGTTQAHRRLAFEELFVLELALATRQRMVKQEVKGVRFDTQTPLIGRLLERLAFRLTPAQERVIAEILHDMASSRPMNRLVQGDVGCGKTIVALHAMLIACGSGYQAALMVPTEILAEQHYLNLRELIQGLGLTVVLLKGGESLGPRRAALRRIETGEAHIVIGTHALIQKGVRFPKLGLAVIDEQHKFGVLQRKTLLEKGYHPDVLVMTATPIPRTLAMTVYGDLDLSVIDALPPGRGPVRTWLLGETQRRRAYQMLRDEVRAGHQAYIVYPLVEESEKVDLRAAIQAAEHLQAGEFSPFRVGLLHGRLRAQEKERVMAAFKSGELHILVTTTVIEVGVDVPNATMMVIEHADRFGLAQLHQLRGRVGRGAHQSHCVLLAFGGHPQGNDKAAGRRLRALVRSSDGFLIAEEDLRIRGPGDFFGIRQWGIPEFRAANLLRDGTLLEQARQEAFALLTSDPSLSAPRHRGLRDAMLRKWTEKLNLGAVS